MLISKDSKPGWGLGGTLVRELRGGFRQALPSLGRVTLAVKLSLGPQQQGGTYGEEICVLNLGESESSSCSCCSSRDFNFKQLICHCEISYRNDYEWVQGCFLE